MLYGNEALRALCRDVEYPNPRLPQPDYLENNVAQILGEKTSYKMQY